LLSKMIRAKTYSFQTVRVLKTAVTASIGLAKGRATYHQIPSFEQPSMRAASSNSLGILSKNVFSRNMLAGSPTLIMQRI